VKKKVVRTYFKDQQLLNFIGERIRDVRISKGLSQEALANECEVDYTQINRMELGKVNFSVSYLSKIAAVLQIKPQDLLP
jgi:transcriptional regulator with XRE-family HTH domain